MRLLPIRITKGHEWSLDGYQRVWSCGEGEWRIKSEKPLRYSYDASRVKFQVWLVGWLYYLPSMPEAIWQFVLDRLWRSRLAYQYERGYANGLRQAYYAPQDFSVLMAEERAALFNITAEQARQLDKYRYAKEETWMGPEHIEKMSVEADAALLKINAEVEINAKATQ